MNVLLAVNVGIAAAIVGNWLLNDAVGMVQLAVGWAAVALSLHHLCIIIVGDDADAKCLVRPGICSVSASLHYWGSKESCIHVHGRIRRTRASSRARTHAPVDFGEKKMMQWCNDAEWKLASGIRSCANIARMGLEDEIADAMTAMKPVLFRPNDAIHAAIGRCIGAGGKTQCEHVGIPGTIPPLCRSHGGAAPLAAASAKLRVEALKSRIQTALEPAVLVAVNKLLAIANTEGPFLEGTVVETEQLSQKGDVVIVKDGVRIRAADIIRATDRILSLAGMTASTLSFVADAEAAEALEQQDDIIEDSNDPLVQLQRMLDASPDDRLLRLADRLSSLRAPHPPRNTPVREGERIASRELTVQSESSAGTSDEERVEDS